jgi:hypothetical protein
MSNTVFYDGVDDSVTVANHATLNITGDITAEVRVKIPPPSHITGAGGAYSKILCKGPPGYNNLGAYGIIIAESTGRIWWILRKSTNDAYDVVGDVAPAPTYTNLSDRWFHIVGTFNGTTGEARLYFNGFMVHNKVFAFTVLNTNVNPLYVGANQEYYYRGLIAETQIYNRVLSDDEVLYNNSHPNNPKRRGLVLNLTQDSIYGPTWLDLSGNANNGTYVGGAVPVTANRLAGR